MVPGLHHESVSLVVLRESRVFEYGEGNSLLFQQDGLT